MSKCKFLRTKLFSYYIDSKVRTLWFKFLNLGLLITQINKKNSQSIKNKGMCIGSWLIIITI